MQDPLASFLENHIFPFLNVNRLRLFSASLRPQVTISPEVSPCHDRAPKLDFLPFTLESNLTHGERGCVKIMSKAKLSVRIVEILVNHAFLLHLRIKTGKKKE